MPLSRKRSLSKEERIEKHERQNAREWKSRRDKRVLVGTSKVKMEGIEYDALQYSSDGITLRRVLRKPKGKAAVKRHKRERRARRIG